MRLRLGLACLALVAACSDTGFEQARADLGCGSIEGLKQLSQKKPDFIIVGEFIETNEAPAAFGELACNLAASGEPLFVGVSEYLGGATDAETRMRSRLDTLTAKGALINIAVIDDGSRENDTRARTRSEKKWAEAITAQVKASGASRALILVAHTDARNESWPRGERFAGYDPMPMHLDGEVLSLEIGSTPVTDLKSPAIRLYPEKTNGFSGQIALASLTRPAVALAVAVGPVAGSSWPGSSGPLNMSELEAVLGSDLTRLEKIDRLTTIFDRSLQDTADWRTQRLGEPKEQAPSPASRWQAARKMATTMVDSRPPSPSPAPGADPPQFPAGDHPLQAPPPGTDLPEFEAVDETP